VAPGGRRGQEARPLCEKPLGLQYAEARELELAAEQGGMVCMVAFTFRFVPHCAYLKRLVSEGHFGEIRHWRLSHLTDLMLDPATPMVWRNDRKQAGAGVLADMGSHGIDCARYLLGDIAAVSGANRLYVRERPDPPARDWCRWMPRTPARLPPSLSTGAIGTFDLNRAVAAGAEAVGRTIRVSRSTAAGARALYELIHPFELQISLGPAMTRTQQWARAEVPFDLTTYPRVAPEFRGWDDPCLGYKWDQEWPSCERSAARRKTYPTFRDGAEAQKVVDGVETAVPRATVGGSFRLIVMGSARAEPMPR